MTLCQMRHRVVPVVVARTTLASLAFPVVVAVATVALAAPVEVLLADRAGAEAEAAMVPRAAARMEPIIAMGDVLPAALLRGQVEAVVRVGAAVMVAQPVLVEAHLAFAVLDTCTSNMVSFSPEGVPGSPVANRARVCPARKDNRVSQAILDVRRTLSNGKAETVDPVVEARVAATGPLVRLADPVGAERVARSCSMPRSSVEELVWISQAVWAGIQRILSSIRVGPGVW